MIGPLNSLDRIWTISESYVTDAAVTLIRKVFSTWVGSSLNQSIPIRPSSQSIGPLLLHTSYLVSFKTEEFFRTIKFISSASSS